VRRAVVKDVRLVHKVVRAGMDVKVFAGIRALKEVLAMILTRSNRIGTSAIR
jgi:deoxyribose-phosphate aldolase